MASLTALRGMLLTRSEVLLVSLLKLDTAQIQIYSNTEVLRDIIGKESKSHKLLSSF